MAAVQAACETCGTALAPDAAYCAKCGTRTARARRLVRLAIRVEAVIFAIFVLMVIAFIWVYLVQR